MQILETIKEKILAFVDGYRETFTKDVWTRSHPLIWPRLMAYSTRQTPCRKIISDVRNDLEQEIERLERFVSVVNPRHGIVKSLRNEIFGGTSTLESRRAIAQQYYHVCQSHKIKILTLVASIYRPLFFVASVFIMTNIPSTNSFVPFGVTLLGVCLPTYMLIGSLNSHQGSASGEKDQKWY